jgi:hypothetical protein
MVRTLVVDLIELSALGAFVTMIWLWASALGGI